MSAVLEPQVAQPGGDVAADKPNLRTLALASFGPWREAAALAKAKLSGTVHDLSTQAKVDEAKSLRQREVGTPLAEARKVSAALKSTLAGISKDVGAELALIEAAYTDAAADFSARIEQRDAELAAEREAKRQAEAKRVAEFRVAIDRIKAFPAHAMAPGMNAERIGKGIKVLEDMVFLPDGWAEFTAEASKARDESLALMRPLYEGAMQREAEAKRLEAERIELAERAAVLAAQEAAAQPANDQRGKAAEPETVGSAGAHRQDAPAPTPPAPTIPTETPKESGCSPADAPAAGTPAMCASSEAQAAQASPSGEDGTGAAADQSRANPDDPVIDHSRIKLGTICERLGFTMTASFVADVLDIHHVGTDKAAKLYTETQFQDICRTLVGHINEVARQEAKP